MCSSQGTLSLGISLLVALSNKKNVDLRIPHSCTLVPEMTLHIEHETTSPRIGT